MTAAAAAAAIALSLRRSLSASQSSYFSICKRLFSSSTSSTKSKPPPLPGFSHATASLHRFLPVVTPGAVRLNPVRFFARDGSINHNPQRSSFLKHRKGTIKGVSGNEICFGKYGLQALESARITSRQIEAGRRAMTQVARRGGGKLWVRIFPYKSVTGKPAEVRMGRGKGNVQYWVAVARPGRILYELGGVAESVARRAIEIAAAKMPIRTRFVIRDKQVKEIGLR